jgi:hypothetical protein
MRDRRARVMRLAIPFVRAAIVVRFERSEVRRYQWHFRLRTLMAVVALVALALASWLEWRRSEYRMWASFHADQERLFRRPVGGDQEAANISEFIKNTYLSGVARPWINVPPDPRYADIHPGGVNYQKTKGEIERFR